MGKDYAKEKNRKKVASLPHDHLCITLVPLLNHLPHEDQLKINQLLHHQVFAKGEHVINPLLDPRLAIVAHGSLKIYQLSPAGQEQLLRVAEAGDYEGENFLFGVENETLYGEALEETEVCFLKRDDFQKLLLSYPEISLKLLTFNAEKASSTEKQASFLLMERVEERLATYLLNLSKTKDSATFTLPLKMKELATFLGTTPETLSRKFKLLEKEKLISRDKKTVTLLDQDGLEDM